jgi:hypothetical protein
VCSWTTHVRGRWCALTVRYRRAMTCVDRLDQQDEKARNQVHALTHSRDCWIVFSEIGEFCGATEASIVCPTLSWSRKCRPSSVMRTRWRRRIERLEGRTACGPQNFRMIVRAVAGGPINLAASSCVRYRVPGGGLTEVIQLEGCGDLSEQALDRFVQRFPIQEPIKESSLVK